MMIDMPETYRFVRNLNVAGTREVPPGSEVNAVKTRVSKWKARFLESKIHKNQWKSMKIQENPGEKQENQTEFSHLATASFMSTPKSTAQRVQASKRKWTACCWSLVSR